MLSLFSRFKDCRPGLALALILSSICGFACTKKNSASSSIRIGVISGPESDIMKVIKEVAKEKETLELEIVEFSDFVTPNIALHDKSLDANAYQHKPYLDSTNTSKGFKLVSVGTSFIYPVAGYSRKIKNFNDLRPGATIAIPNDPSNEGRALLLLEKQGMIQLKAGVGLNAVPADIEVNKKNLKFIEMDAAQLPRALDDADLAVINTVFASSVGLSPKKDGLFMEGGDSLYANIVVVRDEDKQKLWVEKLMRALQSQKVADAAEKIFKGNAIPAWNR